MSPQIQGAPQVGCCSAMPGQHGTGPVPRAVATLRGSWLGLPPRMPRMQSGCVLPAPLPPPTQRTGYSPSREAQGPPPYGKTMGHAVGTAPALGGGALITGEPGGLALRGTQQVCVGSACVDDLLCAKRFMCIHSLTLTTTLGDCFSDEKIEAQEGQGVCLRVPDGKWRGQTHPVQSDSVAQALSN